jgi:hypothetical protein
MKHLLKGILMFLGAIGMISLSAVDSEGTLGFIFFGVFILCVFTAIPLAFIYITLFEEREDFKNEPTTKTQNGCKNHNGVSTDKNKRRALQLWEIGVNE